MTARDRMLRSLRSISVLFRRSSLPGLEAEREYKFHDWTHPGIFSLMAFVNKRIDLLVLQTEVALIIGHRSLHIFRVNRADLRAEATRGFGAALARGVPSLR